MVLSMHTGIAVSINTDGYNIPTLLTMLLLHQNSMVLMVRSILAVLDSMALSIK